ncbi:MAG: hypothetical protein ACREBI_11550 [Nitrosotalea sp.]
MLCNLSKNGIQYAHFFGNMKLDLARELQELWSDVCDLAGKNGYIVDIEFNVISMYQEYGSKLSVIKIIAGKDRHVKKVIRRVFEEAKSDPVEQYEMIGIDGGLPIWKETGVRQD